MKMTAARTFITSQSERAILTGIIGLKSSATAPNSHVRRTLCRAYSRLAIYAEEPHIKTLRSTYMKYGHWVEAAIRRTTAHAAEGMVSFFTCSFMLFPKLFELGLLVTHLCKTTPKRTDQKEYKNKGDDIHSHPA
jgi:hypothetical protein